MGFNLWTNTAERPAHPVKQRANWKWNKFVYYDKESWKELDFKMPEEFIVVADSHTANWWIDSENCWVTSNEIFFWDEPLYVREFREGGKVIMKGVYNDMNTDFKARKFEMKLNWYIIDPKNPDEIKIIQLRGAQLSDFSNSYKGKGNVTSYYRLKMSPNLVEGKKWANKYKVPHFDLAWNLTDEDKALQQKYAMQILEYHNATKPSPIEAEEPVTNDVDSELPF